jgi:hypothetical protein
MISSSQSSDGSKKYFAERIWHPLAMDFCMHNSKAVAFFMDLAYESFRDYPWSDSAKGQLGVYWCLHRMLTEETAKLNSWLAHIHTILGMVLTDTLAPAFHQDHPRLLFSLVGLRLSCGLAVLKFEMNITLLRVGTCRWELIGSSRASFNVINNTIVA